MKTKLNGIDYTEHLVTDEELAVVKAMRLGASVDINFHHLSELNEIDERMSLFADFESEFSRITNGSSYISFYKNMEMIKLTCFMDVKKA